MIYDELVYCFLQKTSPCCYSPCAQVCVRNFIAKQGDSPSIADDSSTMARVVCKLMLRYFMWPVFDVFVLACGLAIRKYLSH